MSTNGSVAIQGCAIRVSALNADGSPTPGATSMFQDDRPFVKLEAKPVLIEGVDITPISACGIPVISYKDCDRYKRWTINLALGDFDPEAQELIGQGAVMTGTSSAGRNSGTADAQVTVNSNIISSVNAAFVGTDIGRAVTDPGFTVATCSATTTDGITTLTTAVTNGFAGASPVTIGQTVQVAGNLFPVDTVVTGINSTTSITVSNYPSAPVTSIAATFFYLPYGAIITEVYNPDISNDLVAGNARIGSLGRGTNPAPIVLTLGALSAPTIGYNYPHLLLTQCPNGVSIEVWSKLIVRGTGFQGTSAAPSAGSPTSPGSAWLRTGVFRAYLWYDGLTVDNKEQQATYQGWAIENPNFGTGPNEDWTVTGVAGGAAVDTTTWCAQLCDINLPSPLQAGFQTPLV